MNSKTTWTISLATLLITTSASAKDLHYAVGDLIGLKVLHAKITVPAKKSGPTLSATEPGKPTLKKKEPSKKDVVAKPKLESTWRRLEFLYTGYMGIQVIGDSGVSAVSVVNGVDAFEWTDDGLVYRIKDYPYDNGHAPISGTIHEGAKQIGKFQLLHKKPGKASVGGRWIGELAFPGGKSLPVGFNIARLGYDSGPGCMARPGHVQFPGHGEQELWLTGCKSDGAVSYTAGFFFLDERSNTRWFVSIEGTHDVFSDGTDAFQGGVWLIPLSGQPTGGEGKLLTFRPEPFLL